MIVSRRAPIGLFLLAGAAAALFACGRADADRLGASGADTDAASGASVSRGPTGSTVATGAMTGPTSATGASGASTSGTASGTDREADASVPVVDSGTEAEDSSDGAKAEASAGAAYKPCPASGPCVIMPLGDSITFGFVPPSNENYGGYRVGLFARAVADHHSITFVGPNANGPTTVSGETFPRGNAGYSGFSIDTEPQTPGGIQPLVDGDIAMYKPNIILLMIGTNDMHDDVDLANAPTRLGNLLDQITADKSDALVVVAQIPDANAPQGAPTIAYNAAIPRLVQARVAQGKHILLVDMYTALGPWSVTGANAHFGDSEHPNITGYGIMANTWYPAISAVLP